MFQYLKQASHFTHTHTHTHVLTRFAHTVRDILSVEHRNVRAVYPAIEAASSEAVRRAVRVEILAPGKCRPLQLGRVKLLCNVTMLLFFGMRPFGHSAIHWLLRRVV